MSDAVVPPSSVDVRLPPISGRRIDPPPPSLTARLARVSRRNEAAGFGYRAFQRWSYSNTTLLAAGTAYYVFLAIFSLATLGYAVASDLSTERLSDSITTALNDAFPGLYGTDGFNSDQFLSVGQAASIVGLVLLAYSGSGAIYATSRSLHSIFGAPKDPRPYVWARIRFLGWLLLLAPMALASYVLSGSVTAFAEDVFSTIGISGPIARIAITAGGIAIALALNFLIVYLLLGHFGGIRPPRIPRIVGSALAALGIEALKYLMAFVVSYSMSQPEYGAFAAPITILLALYLQVITFFTCAAITAGLSDREIVTATSEGQDPSSDSNSVGTSQDASSSASDSSFGQ